MPRGAAFIAKTETGRAVRVWLDVIFPPDDGHLKATNYPFYPEIVIAPRERLDGLEFDVLKGRDVELVVPSRGKRYEVLRDLICTAEPKSLFSLSLDTSEEPIREHIAVD